METSKEQVNEFTPTVMFTKANCVTAKNMVKEN